jgi:glycosyltransferase involved in cell wall biosynthesis
MTEPTISVAMPCYNGARWVAEALRSVLEQTEPPDEVIVVDDGSHDDTAAIVEGFGDRVTLIRQENRGPNAAWARAFRAAGGDYVAMCPQDDVWVAEKLEWQRAVLRLHPGVDVAFGHLRFFGATSGEFMRPPAEGPLDATALLPLMYEYCLVAAPTSLIRRTLYESLGGFRPDGLEDYDFWLRALIAGAQFFYDGRVLANFRAHERNLSRPSLSHAELDYSTRIRFSRYVDDRLAQRVLARDQRVIARHQLQLGRPAAARDAYVKSYRHRPCARTAVAIAALALPPARWGAVHRAQRDPLPWP